MSIHHHPNEELLLDYASGALSEGWSLAIATHLALCPDCRHLVGRLESVGGGLLDGMAPVALDGPAFDAVLSRLDETPPAAVQSSTRASGPSPVLPQPLRGYVGGDVDDIPWKRLGLGAYQAIVPTRDPATTARLLRIPAGKPVPTHTHRGLELTLVLCGAFSDATGAYGRGDLQEADESLEHQPHAAAGEDCICLAVTDAPLRFSGLAARMVQPFIGI